MKLTLRHAAPCVAALVLLATPFSMQAAKALVITPAQKAAAVSQIQEALKTASAPVVESATPRQLAAAIAGVMAKNRGNRAFLGALTEGIVKARPDVVIQIVKVLVASVTPPGECPPADMVWEIVNAAVTADMDAGPAITAAAIQLAPCRAAAITNAAVTANPGAANAIAVAAVGAAPANSKAAIITAAVTAAPPAQGASIAQAAGSAPSGAYGLSGVISTVTNSSLSNGAASTINPANIGGGGAGTIRLPVNSSENINSN